MMKIFTGTLKSVRPAMYIKELMEDKTLSFTIIQYKSVFVCNTKLVLDVYSPVNSKIMGTLLENQS